MTKAYFSQLADYNIWANNLVHSWLDKITEDQWKQHVPSSFNTIAETALHIVGAEKIWVERLERVPNPVWVPGIFKGSKEEVIHEWKSSSLSIKSFIHHFDEAEMHVLLPFKRINGEEQALEFYQIFAHVLNHSTYHRGQLVTMLRQVGFTDVSSTDLLGYYRVIS